MKIKNGLSHLSDDQLDAIATHAGSLLLALHDVKDHDLLPELRTELARIEEQACDHPVNRGVITIFTEGDEIA